MKESECRPYDDLPLFLNSATVAKVLGVSPSSGYELMHQPDYLVLRLGHCMVVPKEQFVQWVKEHFKDSVVFVCVAISARRRNACEQPSKARRLASRKGGMNDGKETSKRRGQHPEKAQRPMGGQIHPGHRPQHRPRHPEKRVRQDTGRMQRETGESHPGQPWYPGEPQRGLHGGGVVPAMV